MMAQFELFLEIMQKSTPATAAAAIARRSLWTPYNHTTNNNCDVQVYLYVSKYVCVYKNISGSHIIAAANVAGK